MNAEPAPGNAFEQGLEQQPWAYDFFHTLRRMECLHHEQPRLGEALRPADEALRCGQDPALAFAPATLSAFIREPGRPPRLEQRFFGLLGANGPLPLHLTEYAHERLLHAGDAAFARFLDVFHHRFLTFFYRAWAQAQPTVSLDRPREDRFADHVGALAGVGSAHFQGREATGDHVRLFHVGWLSRQVRNRDGLEAMIAGYFRLPAQVEEFVGHWLRLPEREHTRLGAGTAAAGLGRGALLGASVWDRQHKFRIHLGPLNLSQYEDFLPGGQALPRLLALVRQYLSFELAWDMRLRLAAQQVPTLSLGGSGRLGWTSWLGGRRPGQDAADLTIDAERLASKEMHATRKEEFHG